MLKIQAMAKLLQDKLGLDDTKVLYDVLDGGLISDLLEALAEGIAAQDPTFFTTTEGK